MKKEGEQGINGDWSQCIFYQYMLVTSTRQLASICDCALLTGDINTSFVTSLHLRPKELRAYTVDLGFSGRSHTKYARYVAKEVGLGDHRILTPSREEFLEAVDWLLEELRVIDPLEIATDAVYYIAVKAAAEDGCRCLLTGDGGKDLFLGYQFMLKLSDEELRAWIRRASTSAWLPTVWLGSKLGVVVVTPLYSEAAKEVALQVPIHCLLDRKNGFEEVLLRSHLEAFGLERIAWRKNSINSGKDFLDALKNIAKDIISDEIIEEAALIQGFKPPTPLHAFLAYRLSELGIEPPPKCNDDNMRCPICGRCITGDHCRYCGAYLVKGKPHFIV